MADIATDKVKNVTQSAEEIAGKVAEQARERGWSCRMAEPLVVRIPHKLGKEEALRRVKPALAKASSSFPVLAVEEETWSGDRLCFGVRALGQIAAGNVEVAEDHVQLEVTLPWLLHKFALLEKK